MKLDASLQYQADGLFMVHKAAITCLAFSHDDQLLVSGDLAGTI